MAVAVIDIGSNSIRYMGKSEKRLEITRLASGLSQTGRLSEPAMRHTASVVRSFVELAREEGLPVFAYATSAVRDCSNREEFLTLLRDACGITPEVLSGADEARYAFLGATGGDGGLIDVGGGSSQIITAHCELSFPMGCVRLKDAAPQVYKSFEAKRAAVYAICERVYKFPKLPSMRWTAVGGSAHTLAALKLGLERYEREKVDGTSLTLTEIKSLSRELFDMGDEARERMPLLAERHDVILYGAMILSYMMRGLGVEAVTVSYADGLEGYAMYVECEARRPRPEGDSGIDARAAQAQPDEQGLKKKAAEVRVSAQSGAVKQDAAEKELERV